MAAFESYFGSPGGNISFGAPMAGGNLLSYLTIEPESNRRIKFKVQAGYDRLFNLPELGARRLNLLYNSHKKSFGAGWHLFGEPGYYQEQVLELGASFVVRPSFLLAFSAGHYSLAIRNYGQEAAVGLQVGTRIILEDQLSWHTCFYNAVQRVMGQSGPALPQVISSSLLYNVTGSITCLLGWEQDTEFPGRMNYGIGWHTADWLTVMLGYSQLPAQFSAGIKFSYFRTSISYAAITHQELGLSQFIGLGINIGSRRSIGTGLN